MLTRDEARRIAANIEEPDAVREGVRVALAKCEAIFRLQEPKKRMRTGRLTPAARPLCRARVAEELQRRRGTRIGEHLKPVLSIIDRRGLELSERGSLAAGDRQGAVHASLAMATAPIVLV